MPPDAANLFSLEMAWTDLVSGNFAADPRHPIEAHARRRKSSSEGEKKKSRLTCSLRAISVMENKWLGIVWRQGRDRKSRPNHTPTQREPPSFTALIDSSVPSAPACRPITAGGGWSELLRGLLPAQSILPWLSKVWFAKAGNRPDTVLTIAASGDGDFRWRLDRDTASHANLYGAIDLSWESGLR